ncbi:hypothetical protein M9434_000695 [Picochlorum sp. BPE23]|nr:hypothetical protein M9434_000695 [Picochlorum sp. BPE23]
MGFSIFSKEETKEIFEKAKELKGSFQDSESVNLTQKQIMRLISLGQRPSTMVQTFATIQQRQEYMNCQDMIASKRRRQGGASPDAKLTSGVLFDLVDWAGVDMDEDDFYLEEDGKMLYIKLATENNWVPSYIHCMRLCILEEMDFEAVFDQKKYPDDDTCRSVVQSFINKIYGNALLPSAKGVQNDDNDVDEGGPSTSTGKLAPVTPPSKKKKRT